MEKTIRTALTVLAALTTSQAFAASPICKDAARIQALSASLKNEELVCLDSVKQKNKETVIFYSKAEGATRVFVAKARLSPAGVPKRVVSVTRVENQDAFPSSCGSALMGVRVLPGSSNIAMLYDNDVIRVVNAPRDIIVKTVDHREENAAYTCGGYTPNAKALRDRVIVLPKKGAVQYTYGDWSQEVESCPNTKLSKSELKEIEEEIVNTQAQIVRRTKRAAEATNPAQKKMEEQQVEMQGKFLKRLLASKKSGLDQVNCSTTAKQITARFQYK